MKNKVNRMGKKRKFIKNTAAFRKRQETRKHQRLARENGVFSPRKLARSVGIFVGMVTDEINPKEAAFNWKAYVEAVIKHPKEFHAMMNPKKDIQDSSGTVSRVIRKVKA